MPAQRNLRRSRRVNLQIGRRHGHLGHLGVFRCQAKLGSCWRGRKPTSRLSGRVADHPHKRSEPSALLRPGRAPSSIALFARGAQPLAAVGCRHGRAIRPFVARFAVRSTSAARKKPSTSSSKLDDGFNSFCMSGLTRAYNSASSARSWRRLGRQLRRPASSRFAVFGLTRASN